MPHQCTNISGDKRKPMRASFQKTSRLPSIHGYGVNVVHLRVLSQFPLLDKSRNSTNFHMPAVKTSLEYLQKLPLYEEEKPYYCLLSPDDKSIDPSEQRLDNLEFEEHKNVTIRDIRELTSGASIEDCGFQVLSHSSKISQFNSATDIDDYRRETEALLKEELKAEYVHCYDSRLRKNLPFQHTHIDLNDPLIVEGPARGVHNGMLSTYVVPHLQDFEC